MRKRKRGATAVARDNSEAKEDHKKPIYHIATLHPPCQDGTQLFATIGANRASVYELSQEGEISLLTMFIDHDQSEVFYCVAWGRPEAPPPQKSIGERQMYIAFAGENGCLFVRHLDNKLQPLDANPLMSLVAHGGPINMIRVAPLDQNIIFSASKDESVRMWSAFSGACVAVFAGGQGHTSEVLSIDLHMDGTRLVSAGMDNTVRVWDVDCQGHLKQAIEGGHAAEKGSYFKPKVVQTPAFVTDLSCEWKPNYIDCVQWVGDLLLAKSVHDRILLFDIAKPNHRSKKETALVLQDFVLTQCNIWFLRFSLDPSFKYLAVGNIAGTVMIWDIDQGKAPIVKLTYPCTPKQPCTIRHCVFAMNSKYLIAGTDDAKVIVWKTGIPQESDD